MIILTTPHGTHLNRVFCIANIEPSTDEKGINTLCLQSVGNDNHWRPFTLVDVHYLVNFMGRNSRTVTDLDINFNVDAQSFRLSDPPDGGFEMQRSFFENDTTLSTIRLSECDFGSTERTS